MLAEAYEKLKTIEDKTQNVQQRVHLMRRNDEFEDVRKAPSDREILERGE